ncbi:MAG TPA: sugar phosphate isomerase/epimerase family protein [Armatimonadota bacterium]|jgi:sugar phosphate isomerase/epimerase|nr:sugar phosphate isomerase/epimerase family protein [Armatimonadota bacterium]
MKLSFMTWACPDWDINQIITGAIRYGYDGVEPRVEAKQKHGIDLELKKKDRKEIRQQFEDCGLDISCLATSRTYSSADASERAESVELTKKYVDLAADMGCPTIRVFGGGLPEGVERPDAHKYVAECLRECGEHAKSRKVFVCLETHDSFSRAEHCVETVKLADHPNVQIVWDFMHPFRAGNSHAEAFELVKPYVKHCHVHDGSLPEGPSGPVSLALMGDGDIPHDEPVKLLASIDFEGHLSGEWISFLPADEVLPHDARMLRMYIEEA